MMQGQRGITGPETAIILSAFVIVASVFAFTILPVGNFAAQQSSETADAGIEQARGTLNRVDGSSPGPGASREPRARCRLPSRCRSQFDGQAVDLTPPHTVNDTGTDHGDYPLEKNDTAEITVMFNQKRANGTHALGTATDDFLQNPLGATHEI